MKKIHFIPAILLLLILTGFKSDKPAYQIFNEKGRTVKYKKMLRKIADADVVFFGELHNNPVAHWLQLEVTRDLYKEKNGNLVLGAEMFEADNQVIIDEYLQGTIRQKDFENEARLWSNYETDYKPLMEMAADSGLRFVATNIPRRYAALVNTKGLKALDSLSQEAKKWIAPLPVEFDSTLTGYKKMKEMMGVMGGHGRTMNIVKAQAVKDATMAHFIAENLQPGKQFIHYNGAYHSDNFEGIIWYLNRMKPDLNIKTITTKEQVELKDLHEKHEGVANFIIAVDENMTKTY